MCIFDFMNIYNIELHEHVTIELNACDLLWMVIKRELCMVSCMDLIIDFICYETSLNCELMSCESLVTTGFGFFGILVKSMVLDLFLEYRKLIICGK